jgi:hypothetical protein
MIRLQGNEARGQIAIALRTLLRARTPLSRRVSLALCALGFGYACPPETRSLT